MPLTKEKKQEIIKKFAGNEKNTGDTSAQIALLTERIALLTNHLQNNKKDFVTQRTLIKLVNQRKKLLNYLKKHNLEKYRTLIKTLDIRK
ncbi:MAG: 30S ribosomal protein S15 [Bacteroidetes bacterium]|jgi:small subunit ribosomal protein S15|nr:MAG: 30S ribosomal protein S15 [Bacteroidota bacterium]